tara:strand:+ start:4159 stop:5157 length:999 start_codon:yes stop_codon:yes gene_type:complete
MARKKKSIDLEGYLTKLQSEKYKNKLPKPENGYFRFTQLAKIKGFGLKKGAFQYFVVIDRNGNAIDLVHEDDYESKKQDYVGLANNINIKEEQELKKKKLIAEEELKLGIEREKNEKLLKELRSDSEKIDGRFNDAQKRYLEARKALEDYVAEEIKVNKNRPAYQRKLRELQNTAEYKILAQDEIDALKRFFKVSNALSGLSEELAASDQNYQAIDYNKKVQDIVTEPTGLFGTMAGKPRRIPEGDPGSIDRNRIRDYRSQADVERELAQKHAGVATGVLEGAGEGESSEDYSQRMLRTVSAPEPEKTPYETFSTDELLELLIKENKKKTGQ